MATWLAGYPVTRRSPRLWIEDLWLLESLEPLLFTRHIKLRQGLNVIWAREPESDDASGLASAGHGVGKTSLCYLLRHCLGDEAPSISALCDKASGTFPKGGIAAKVHLNGVTWVVYRPYASFGRSIGGRGGSLEDLLSDQLEGSFAEYLEALQATFIGSLSSSTLPGSTQTLEWRHLLAWCIRDQKTRFDAFFHWRDGDGLGFRRSRQDPPLFVRSVLGLQHRDLDELMRKVDAFQTNLKKLDAELPDLERLPAFELMQAERHLRTRLGAADHITVFRDMASISLEELVDQRLDKEEKDRKLIESSVDTVEEALGSALASLNDLERSAKFHEIELGVVQSLMDNNEAEFNRLSNELAELERLAGHCRHGDLDFSKCEHVIQRRTTHSMSWRLRKQAAAVDLAKQA